MLTPLVLITGVLGAGKTTVVRAMVRGLHARGIAPSVILNDYLNARVDAATIPSLAEQVVPIGGTCVCCASRAELTAALEGAALPERSVMLVEANGTADPAELIEVLAADRAAARYTLPVQVSVIDVSRWQRRGWQNELEAEQVQTATHIVLTRAEEVDATRRRDVEEALADLAPRAGLVGVEALTETVAGIADAPELAPRRFGGASADHHHDPRRHHFSAAEFPLAPLVERGALESWLHALPPEAVRVKGVAQLAGDGGWCYFERLEGADAVRLTPIRGERLEPVAILIGPQLPPDLELGELATTGAPG